MDDYDFQNYYNGLIDPSFFTNNKNRTKKQDDKVADYLKRNLFVTEGPQEEYFACPQFSRGTATRMPKSIGDSQQFANAQEHDLRETSTEPYCHVKVDSIVKLKDSTKKLLCLVEEIQSKSHSKHPICVLPASSSSDRGVNPQSHTEIVNSVTEVSSSVLKRLEIQTKILDSIPTPEEDDDCSVFKKLTRKCNCLNQQEYNDFLIHFNESTKYYTSTTGEIIKNLRILKKFLYMGGDYAKHALMFLNEGLGESSYAEKIDIVQGCAHADMCNVFEDLSIIITYIAWPYKYDSYGDTVTQELAAEFVYKLAQLEEGRRYLKFTSKITNDTKKVLRKKGSKLQIKTLECLQSILKEMHPQNELNENNTDTFHRRPGDEGFGNQTMKALIYYRQYMTSDEIFTHLDLLNKWSVLEKGKTELKNCRKDLLQLFKDMLLSYNDSEMNIIIADVLNNLISKDIIEEQETRIPKLIMIADTSTDPIQLRDEAVQKSTKKVNTKRKAVRSTRRNDNHIIIVPLEE